MLSNELALVTGASRGIGRAIATELGREGAAVVATATSQSGAEEIDNYLNKNDIAGCGVVLDVTDPATIEDAVKVIERSYARLPSVLVNNAGITRDNLMLRMKEQEWDDIINTNLSAVYRLTKACLRAMIKERHGRIINISSVVAFTGNPGQANYAAAKAGMVGMSKSLAYEVASRGITVNCIAPGFITTAMTEKLTDDQKARILTQVPAGRMGETAEIAAAALYLASPEAGYVTGATLHINGGMAMI
jgi:3-oxoacyl-[acyl-carrier protein] reductase